MIASNFGLQVLRSIWVPSDVTVFLAVDVCVFVYHSFGCYYNLYIVIQPTLLISVSLLRFATLITSGLALSVIADFSRHLLAEYC